MNFRRLCSMTLLLAVCSWYGAADGDEPDKPVGAAATEQRGAHDEAAPSAPGYVRYAQSHLDRMLAVGTDAVGEKTAMWLAAVDPLRGGLPQRRDPLGNRWYRQIHSPAGSNLYWDQPLLVAAHAMSRQTGDDRYAAAADRYVRDFLDRCVAEPTGLFLWGNHIYYDVETDRIVQFSGGYHEMRPHPAAWAAIWRVSPEAAQRQILAMQRYHVRDQATGHFCRHADPFAKAPPRPGESSMPFLEAGAVLIEALAWLAERRPELRDELARHAQKIAEYSYAQRDERTGLVRNQPVVRRWDYHASTTEVGLWAGSLLRAAELLEEPRLREIADAALSAWLRYGWDEEVGRYFGQLEVATGKPLDPGPAPEHQPRRHSLVWQVDTAPTHDYPLPMAEACLTLYKQTGKADYRLATQRWIEHVRGSLPAGEGRGGYTDEYGRVIHFLCRAADELRDPSLRRLAREVADDAMEKLFVPQAGMFRTHGGEVRTDAIDGPGVLLLALLYLETGTQPDLMGFAF